MGRIARALRALAAALAGTGGNGFAGRCFSLSAYSVLRQPLRILRLLPQCLERRLQPDLHRQNHCEAGTGSRNPSRKRQNPCRLFRRRYTYRFADRRFGAPDTRVLPPSADVWDGGAAAAAPCTAVDEIPRDHMDRKGLAAALIAGRNTPSKQIFSVTGRTRPNTQMPSEHTSDGIFQYFSQLLRPLSRARRDNVRRSGLVCRLKRCRRHCCRCTRNLPPAKHHVSYFESDWRNVIL